MSKLQHPVPDSFIDSFGGLVYIVDWLWGEPSATPEQTLTRAKAMLEMSEFAKTAQKRNPR